MLPNATMMTPERHSAIQKAIADACIPNCMCNDIYFSRKTTATMSRNEYEYITNELMTLSETNKGARALTKDIPNPKIKPAPSEKDAEYFIGYGIIMKSFRNGDAFTPDTYAQDAWAPVTLLRALNTNLNKPMIHLTPEQELHDVFVYKDHFCNFRMIAERFCPCAFLMRSTIPVCDLSKQSEPEEFCGWGLTPEPRKGETIFGSMMHRSGLVFIRKVDALPADSIQNWKDYIDHDKLQWVAQNAF